MASRSEPELGLVVNVKSDPVDHIGLLLPLRITAPRKGDENRTEVAAGVTSTD